MEEFEEAYHTYLNFFFIQKESLFSVMTGIHTTVYLYRPVQVACTS